MMMFLIVPYRDVGDTVPLSAAERRQYKAVVWFRGYCRDTGQIW